ncbi:hypothetical protein HaLaN_13868 [Haematococcus lacustris]|uniref:Uncharacterized protein n=1 Tax=Haematococcus lacustris TaxID=44745 RepID=A0A699ZN39_HAELA|nr:hypothetical protein HaLaN_13868 [Haematococcus lacustris]
MRSPVVCPGKVPSSWGLQSSRVRPRMLQLDSPLQPSANTHAQLSQADVELGRSCQASWSAQFQLAARELLWDEFTLSPDMVLGTKALEVKWLERWGRRWVGFEGDPRLPETLHRERCSYAAWFKHGDGIGINHMAPHLLNRQLSTEVRTSLTRFRLGNNGLGVEKARFEGVTFIDRTCTRCTEQGVDDAMQFIFECTATSSIREQPEFAMTLQNSDENLHDFMLSPCAPCFEVRYRKSRTPRGGGRPSSLTADGLSGVSHIIMADALVCQACTSKWPGVVMMAYTTKAIRS